MYGYCYDTTDDNWCVERINRPFETPSLTIGGLAPATTYYWKVWASNDNGTTPSDGDIFWRFTTPVSPSVAFEKIGPANGKTGASTTSVALDWGESLGATAYEYCVDATNDGACAAWTSVGASRTATLSGLAPLTTYYWQVRATGATETYGDGSSAAYWSFTTKEAPPGAFGKIGPVDGSADLSQPVTLSWNASPGATSYQYCVERLVSVPYSQCERSPLWWGHAGTATSVSVSGLDAGSRLYWRVRALNAGGETYADGSSSAWSFATYAEPPGAFAKSSPADGATGQSTSATLSWGTSVGAAAYEYCLDSTDDHACGAWTGTGTTASVGLTGLSANTTYYWQVRATNPGGTAYANGVGGDWSLTTGQLAELSSPAPGSTLTASTVTFQWTGGAGVTQYYLQVGTTAGGADLYDRDQGTSLSATVGNLPAGGQTVYVRLWSRISGDWQSQMHTYTAMTAGGGAGPVKAELSSPAPSSTLAASTATFQWTGGTGVTQYYLQVGTTAGGADLYDRDQGTNLSATVSNLPTDGRTVHIRLWSRISGDWQSNLYTCTAMTAGGGAGPEKAELSSPAPSSTLTASTVTFQWTGGTGVTQYYLKVGTTAGGADLYEHDQGTNLSVTVGNLPTDGRTVYVRLYSYVDVERNWQSNSYTYTAMTAGGASPVKAELSSPAPGSTLAASTVTFQWTGGTGVTQYYLQVGTTLGGADLYERDQGTNLSATVGNLPTDGRTVHIRLWSRINGAWESNLYTCSAAAQ
jgi:serine protease